MFLLLYIIQVFGYIEEIKLHFIIKLFDFIILLHFKLYY